MDEPALSGVLAEIAEIAGIAAALQVARAKGGTEAFIPYARNLRDNHWLVEAVGWDAARLIADRLGSGHIEVPLGPAGSRAKTWAIINKALADGKSAPQAARIAGVHHRTVRRHRQGQSGQMQEDDRQPSLPLLRR